MVKASTVIVASLLAVGPALAYANSYDEYSTRDLAEADLYEREFEDLFEAREFTELSIRETTELYERDPFLGRILGGAKRLLFGRDIEDLSEREVDELVQEVVARDPFLGRILGGAKRLLFGREAEGLETRSPFLGRILGGAKRLLFGRDELEAIEARDPFIGRILGGAKRLLFGRAAEDLDLDARDPFLGRILGGAKRLLFGRDFIDEEFDARSFDSSNLDELD